MATRAEVLEELDATFRPNAPLKESLLEKVQFQGLLRPLAALISSRERCSDSHEASAGQWAVQALARAEQTLEKGGGQPGHVVALLEGLSMVATALWNRAVASGRDAPWDPRGLKQRAQLAHLRSRVVAAAMHVADGDEGAAEEIKKRDEALRGIGLPLLLDSLTRPLARSRTGGVWGIATLLDALQGSADAAVRLTELEGIVAVAVAYLVAQSSSSSSSSSSASPHDLARQLEGLASPVVVDLGAPKAAASLGVSLWFLDALDPRCPNPEHIEVACALLCSGGVKAALPQHLSSPILRVVCAHAPPSSSTPAHSAILRTCASLNLTLAASTLIDKCAYVRALLCSPSGANGGLDAAVRYVRTHHDVTFHATVPYESASHQPRPSERVRTAAYDALEACGCSVQPGSVSVVEKHRGDGVWAVTVRCEGGEEALSLREALFPGDQRKPSRAERVFTDSLREGGGDRLVASDWATLSDQSPDPSTFGVVFSFLVACCLGSSTVDGAAPSARGVSIGPLISMSLRPEEARLLEGLLLVPDARFEDIGKALGADTSDAATISRVWGQVCDDASARANHGGGQSLHFVLSLLHRRYGQAHSMASSDRGSKHGRTGAFGILEEQALSVLASPALPAVQTNPRSLSSVVGVGGGGVGVGAGEAGYGMGQITAFERQLVWDSLGGAGAGAGAGAGGGGDSAMADVSLLAPFSAPPMSAPQGTPNGAPTPPQLNIVPSSVRQSINESAEWTAGSASTRLGGSTVGSMNLSRASISSAPFTPGRLISQQEHAPMGVPSPYVPAWMVKAADNGASTQQRTSFGSRPPRTPMSAAKLAMSRSGGAAPRASFGSPHVSPVTPGGWGAGTPGSFASGDTFMADEEVRFGHRRSIAPVGDAHADAATPSPGSLSFTPHKEGGPLTASSLGGVVGTPMSSRARASGGRATRSRTRMGGW